MIEGCRGRIIAVLFRIAKGNDIDGDRLGIESHGIVASHEHVRAEVRQLLAQCYKRLPQAIAGLLFAAAPPQQGLESRPRRGSARRQSQNGEKGTRLAARQMNLAAGPIQEMESAGQFQARQL